jgi:hypothetical protein
MVRAEIICAMLKVKFVKVKVRIAIATEEDVMYNPS